MSESTLFYKVQKGDTLSGIAQRHGASIQELQTINGIKDPDRIAIGQVIALKAQTGCKVQFLLLDSILNPIKKVRVRLDYCGKREIFTSGNDGLLPPILTNAPGDVILIFIAKLDGTWKKITTVKVIRNKSRYTVISPKTMYDEETKPHPKGPDGLPIPEPNRRDKNPASPTDDRLPYKKPKNDQVKLDFLGGYTGEKITEEDYKKAAMELGCEVNVIKAIGEQESKKLKNLRLGGFDKNNRPTILYERHYFSRLTKHKYDHLYPDISFPSPYKAGTARQQGKPFDDGQHFGLYSWQYKKLAKAYALKKEAAIRSCSWGTFQVMGNNYKACGFNSAFEYAKAMSKSEVEHLKAMVAYCKSKKLQKALKTKDWKAIAMGYNGIGYKKQKYDLNLKSCYEALKKKEL